MTATAADRLTPAQRDATVRWKLGHQVFHLLLATMNTRLDEVCRLLDAEDWEALPPALLDLAGLYDAATATMRYAADFPRSEYETMVRPSMMPPFASAGFSGVYNAEHAAMLSGMQELRLRFIRRRAVVSAPVPAPVSAAWRQLLDAQRRNRRHHMLVCRRFVESGPSLLQRHFARGRSRPPRSPGVPR